MALFATKTLKTLGVEPKGRIVFLHNSDEEIGSPSSKCYIEEEAKKSKAVLVLEPSIPGGALKTWRKGVATFEIKINGRGGHAGADYYEGASAILEAAHQTVYLHSLSSFEDGTTVNVGVVNGGIASNVIADEVLLNVDVRVKTAEAGERITKKILELKPVDSNTSIKIEGGMNRPPMERNSRNLALFRIAEQVAAQMSINLTESGTGGASDGNFTSALGIPTLDGLGAVGGGGHSVDEHLEVTSLIERGAILAGLLFKLG